jgi:hypothetical protein
VRRILGVAALLLAAGCATFEDRLAGHLQSPSLRECAQWFVMLDERVDSAGVRDAQHARVAGFPYLRVDRLLASLSGRAAERPDTLVTLAGRMRALDYEARRHEVDNLPDEALDRTRAEALRRTEDCGMQLVAADLLDAPGRAALVSAARVPDDYSTAMRAFGFYALTRIPFSSGVRRFEDEIRGGFAADPAPASNRVRYAPPPGRPLSRAAVKGLLERAQSDPLGQPLISERELDALAATYAPSFDIAVAGDYDRFGALRWRRGEPAPAVDATEPVVYAQAGYARYGDAVLLQIAYTLWFPERPATSSLDILAGRLDGVVWRVTLAPDGEPVMHDSIHPCGCYHWFFPSPRAKPRAAPDASEEWAFAPQVMPRLRDGERPLVSIASATHFIERIGAVSGPDSLVHYGLRRYDELRSLSRMDGSRRSVFRPDGLIAGSERGERFLYWPMGIASAGAMRQWGRHATAFIGRRHFDDADLIEKRFALDLAGEAK